MTPRDTAKLVINLSSRTLNPTELQVLALGLNYAISPSTIPVNEIITSTEAVARKLDSNTPEQLRAGVSNALRTARPPCPNISYTQKRPLKDLHKDNTIVILPADKGNATVVMDRSLYEEKMKDILLDGNTYKLKKGSNHTY